MANLKILKGLETALPVNSAEGSLYFTEDTGRLLLGDNSGGYVKFSEVLTVTNLPLTPIEDKIYIWNKGLYVWDGVEWSQVGNGTGGSLPYNKNFETTDWEVDGTIYKLEIEATEHKQGTQKFLILQVFDGTGSLNTSYTINDEGLITLKSDTAFDGYVIVSNLNNSAPLYNEHGFLGGRDEVGNHEKIIPSGNDFKVVKNDGITDVFTVNTNTGVLTVNTADYETLLANSGDLPNKKYVDDGLSLKAGKDEENSFTEKQTFKAKTNASIGTELITDIRDSDFSGDSGNWAGTNWTIGGGVYTHTAGENIATLNAYAAEIGKYYIIKADITTTTIGQVKLNYGGIDGISIGEKIELFSGYAMSVNATSIENLKIIPNSTWEGTIDNISIKEVIINSPAIVINNSVGTESLGINAFGGGVFAIGNNCLRNAVTDTVTTTFAVGSNTARALSEGAGNTFISTNAGLNITKTNNTTAIGRDALRNLIKGDNNTVIGEDSLRFLKNGSNNLAVGVNAGAYLSNGASENVNSSQGVYLGANVKAGSADTINEIVIGNSATGGGSNTVTLGNSNITALRCQVTTITSLSDSRVKDDVSEADTQLCYDTVKNLKVSRFKYKDFTGKHLDGHRLGFMADDLEVVRPKCVTKSDRTFPILNENGEIIYREVTLDTGEVVNVPDVEVLKDVKEIAFYDDVPTLWGAVQKLMEKITVLEQEIELLKK